MSQLTDDWLRAAIMRLISIALLLLLQGLLIRSRMTQTEDVLVPGLLLHGVLVPVEKIGLGVGIPTRLELPIFQRHLEIKLRKNF